jgi:hypothetical protein
VDVLIDAPRPAGAPSSSSASSAPARRSAADVEAELQWRRGAVLCALAVLRSRNAAANAPELRAAVRAACSMPRRGRACSTRARRAATRTLGRTRDRTNFADHQ